MTLLMKDERSSSLELVWKRFHFNMLMHFFSTELLLSFSQWKGKKAPGSWAVGQFKKRKQSLKGKKSRNSLNRLNLSDDDSHRIRRLCDAFVWCEVHFQLSNWTDRQTQPYILLLLQIKMRIHACSYSCLTQSQFFPSSLFHLKKIQTAIL